MKKEELTGTTVTLQGKEVVFDQCKLPQKELLFYPDNPRIYSIVNVGNKEPSQKEIEDRLINNMGDHIQQLAQSIKANGGLIDPIIVRKKGDSFIVLEGNSRLAAYRLLARKDPVKWGKIKCWVLPVKTSDSDIFALLGEYHIIGKKDWQPYERAGYLWRRNKIHKVSEQVMANDMGLSLKEIKQDIYVYDFMVKNNEPVGRWSYWADTYLKNRKIANMRRLDPKLDKVILSKVKSGEISRAVDMRDKVVPIIKAGGKTLNKFKKKKNVIDECCESAKNRGVDNDFLNNILRFRKKLSDPALKSELIAMPENQRNKCKLGLRQILKTISIVLKRL